MLLAVGQRIVVADGVAPAISEHSPVGRAAVAEQFSEQVLVVVAEPVLAAEQAPVVEPLVVVGAFVRGPASSECSPVPAVGHKPAAAGAFGH